MKERINKILEELSLLKGLLWSYGDLNWLGVEEVMIKLVKVRDNIDGNN